MNSGNAPTAAEDFGAARLIITLPVPGPKGPLRVEIEAATLEEIIPLLNGLPGSGHDQREQADGDPLELTLHFLERYETQAKVIVNRWVVSPRISFDGPKDGCVEWRSLHLQNRLAIVNGITRFSQSGSAGEAEQLATFPALEQGGARNGRGDRGVVEAGNAAASHVPEASRPVAGRSAAVQRLGHPVGKAVPAHARRDDEGTRDHR